MVPFFKDENSRPFPHHETVAIPVEWPRGARRLLVPRGHCSDGGEGAERQWHQGRLGAAGEGDIHDARPHGLERVANSHRACRAAVGIAGAGTVEPEVHGHVRARRGTEYRERQQWVRGVEAAGHEPGVLVFRPWGATQRGTQVDAGAIAIFGLEVDVAVRQRHRGCRQRKLRVAIQSMYQLPRHVIVRLEIAHLGCYMRGEA